MKNWNKILILALWIALVLILAAGWRIRHEIKSYSRAIDTVNIGTTANDGTGDPLRTAFIKINEALYMLDTLNVDAMRAQYFANLSHLIDSLNQMRQAINDSLEERLAAAEEGVSMTRWNNGIEPNYIKGLQAAGMSILAGPTFGFYPRVSHTIYDGTAIYTQFYLDDTLSVTGVGFLQDTQGAYTADNYNGFAIYSVSGTTYTKIDSTANNGNIWKTAANTSATAAFSAGPHSLNPGIYYVLLLYNSSAQTTAPKIYFNNDFLHAAVSGLTGTNKIGGQVAAQTTPPMTETGGDITATNEIPAIWLY